MTEPCKSCGCTPCAPHCAWAIVAPVPRSIVRAAIDPGSRWIAVTVTRDDGPGSPCTFGDARVFEVGRWVEFPEPQTRFKKLRPLDDVPVEGPLEPYTVTGERMLTEADASAAASQIVTYLLAHHVDEVATEHVRHVHGGGAATALLKSAGVYMRIVDRLEQLGIAVRYVLASTWRAQLNPLVKASLAAQGKPTKGVLITKATGAVLDPVFAEHLATWPGIERWTKDEAPHIRDSTGLALACGLPALVKRVARAGAPRVRRPRVGGKRTPRDPRGRAALSPAALAKVRATSRRWEQRQRDAALLPAIAKRAALGCFCAAAGPSLHGHHGDACAVGKAMMRARAAQCSCRDEPTSREGRHRASCAIRRALDRARAAQCSCVVEKPRLAGRHKATCPLHRARARCKRRRVSGLTLGG